MMNCWDETPCKRKSFTDLRKHFDAMLSSMTSKVSIRLRRDWVVAWLKVLLLSIFFEGGGEGECNKDLQTCQFFIQDAP